MQLPPALEHPSDELEIVGEGVGVADGAEVGDGVEPTDGVGDGVGITDDVEEGDGLGDAEAVGSGVAVGVTFGEGPTLATDFLTITPLLQTSLPLTLMHVYFLPATVEVFPRLEQGAPAFTTA